MNVLPFLGFRLDGNAVLNVTLIVGLPRRPLEVLDRLLCVLPRPATAARALAVQKEGDRLAIGRANLACKCQ